jgi:negative regulator of flagellin synthesis FlgM
MQIRPTNNLQNTQSVNLATQRADQSNATANQAPVDQLDLSTEAQMLAGGEIRADRVAQVKAEIASGVYETDAKLDAAIDRLLDEIA